MTFRPPPRPLPLYAFRFSLLALLLSLSGCAALGVAAYKLAPPETIKPKYANLRNESVGIMVWADRGIRIDWPTLRLDLANNIQNKLKAAQADKDNQKKKDYVLLGTTFPYPPASIVRYQMDHPETEAMSIDAIAPKLGVTRLIYVELQDFGTRSDMALDLYRGRGRANVRVYEIANGQAKMAEEWNNVEASYPPKAPPEGMPNLGDGRTYGGTIDAFGTEIAHLFVPYQVDED